MTLTVENRVALTTRARSRFGLGPRPDEPAELGDPRGWLTDQLRPGAGTTTSGPDLAAIFRTTADLRSARGSRDQEAATAARRAVRELLDTEMGRMLDARIVSTTPFVERLVAFWSNHLCISVTKGQAAPFAGHYERTVIRPHVLGRFADMVLASAQHPAMLLYLDNAQSIGPESALGRRSARSDRRRGLNENYARELMELHTVGVNGGYTQDDVIALAKVLTGWTIAGLGPRDRDNETPGFIFRPQLHQPGAKAVLGKRYSDAGMDEGKAVIRDLCHHPSTARHLAAKLVRHFVADEPPAEAVESIAVVFTRSEGNLLEVARALVSLDAAWDPANLKFRSPLDWITAAFRALDVDESPRQTPALLRQLGQPVWGPSAPNGFGDTRNDWADPDSLMNRAEAARTFTRQARGGVDPQQLAGRLDLGESDPLRRMVTDQSIPHNERLALVIGGPAFQWR